MSKHVLVISASPRKGGNSDTLCDEFIRGVQESGNQAEKIFLASRKIGYCIGCGVCNTTHKCVQKDEMAEILDKWWMQMSLYWLHRCILHHGCTDEDID